MEKKEKNMRIRRMRKSQIFALPFFRAGRAGGFLFSATERLTVCGSVRKPWNRNDLCLR